MKYVALITGASSGIGKELAAIHAQHGGDLILVARSEQKLQEIKAQLSAKYGVEIALIIQDLSTPDGPTKVHTALKTMGIVPDVLINNAGFGGIGKFHERDWSNDLEMIHLNVIALTALTRMIVPEMVKRGSGKILNISSTASLMPGPLQAVYFATKAFVTSFSNAIAEELRGTGVTVTALLPGATETSFGKVSGMDKTMLFDKTASAATVALSGYKAMMAGKLNQLAGVPFALRIMMAFIPLSPKRIMLKVVRKMQETK